MVLLTAGAAGPLKPLSDEIKSLSRRVVFEHVKEACPDSLGFCDTDLKSFGIRLSGYFAKKCH